MNIQRALLSPPKLKWEDKLIASLGSAYVMLPVCGVVPFTLVHSSLRKDRNIRGYPHRRFHTSNAFAAYFRSQNRLRAYWFRKRHVEQVRCCCVIQVWRH